MSALEPRLKVDAFDFSPAFMETPEPDTIPSGATPDAKNALLINIEEGVNQVRACLRKRTGHRMVTPTVLSAGKSIDGLFEFLRDNAAGELLAMCNGVLKKFDNIDTFTGVTGGTGWTATARARALAFKNNLHVTDGTFQLRYDGTGCYPIGFVAPTGAPTLTVGAAGAVTGTYEGFAVWVDSTTTHMSSPSATTAAVAFVAQKRVWAKPAGAPPANVTHWRVFSRRTDTNEANFFQTGADQLVATASYTEEVSDDLRRVIGPAPNSNDVPPVFAFAEEFKGYRIGVKPDSSDIWISKLLDAESQHPSDVFPVGGRGDTKPVRSVKKYLTECLIQKPLKTYHLVGDSVPFKIDPIDGSFGNVSQESGLPVGKYFYGWDDRHGPYRTDLSTWEALANGKILTTLASVNRTYLNKIAAVYIEEMAVIVWFVPTTTARLRTALAFNTRLSCWYPPITGIEWTAAARYTTPSGDLDTYVGDEWGRIFTMFDNENDGVPSGTLLGTITAATSGSITAAAAAFYTTGSGLAGIPAAAVGPDGSWQWVRISSNTGTVLTLDTVNGASLSPVPDPTAGTWYVVVGGIDFYWDTPRTTFARTWIKKLIHFLFVQGSTTSASHILEALIRVNRSEATFATKQFTFPPSGMSWGDVWGSIWGAAGNRATRKRRLHITVEDIQVRFRNGYADQPVEIAGYRLTADPKEGRSSSSA